ncbi:hypothetical protein [Actinokineospora sp. NPDC004072]
MRTLSSQLAQGEGAREELAKAESRLDGWHGDAKAALVGKIENVRSHLDRMADEVDKVHLIVGGFYALAIHARTSHLLLCRETEAAALREISNQEKRDDKLALAVGTKVLGAVLDFDPKAPLKSSLGAFVELADVTGAYLIDGNDAADVANNHLIAGNETTRHLAHGVRGEGGERAETDG